MGVPRVRPRSTPDKMVTVSDSLRGVVRCDAPGRRRSNCGWMSATLSGMRAGQPSTTQPIALPCDSPNVVTRNKVPNVLAINQKSPTHQIMPACHGNQREKFTGAIVTQAGEESYLTNDWAKDTFVRQKN